MGCKKKDVNQAIIWLKKAAEKGLVEAQSNLVILYESEDPQRENAARKIIFEH